MYLLLKVPVYKECNYY